MRRAARRARATLRDRNLTRPPYGRALLARGRTHGLRGALAASVSSLEAAVVVLRPGPCPLELADALPWLAQARHHAGSPDSARPARGEARLAPEDLPELGILAERWEATERLLAGEQADAAATAPITMDEPSTRERDVLKLLPTGLSEAEIGRELFISYHTVHSHVRTIDRKLGTSSRAQTVGRTRLPPARLGQSVGGAGRPT